MTRAVTLVAALAAAALLGAAEGAATQAQSTTLTASVGPGLTISLRTAGGAAVTRLNPGTYTVNVNDQSEFHSFALSGPGVSEDSGVAFIGTVSWTVTLANGTYTFRCTVHPTSMRGTFTGGTGASPVKTITPATRLVVTSGPAQVITLKTAGGAAVKQMKVGNYNVTVRDRGRIHNVHLRGPGFNQRTTPLSYTGTKKWKVTLKRAGTLRFICDPHAALGMKGSAKVVR
jgi:plastocyanin